MMAGNGPGLTINFAIPGQGVQTITVSGTLPAITQALTINGYSQGGGSSSGPLVQINGNEDAAGGLEVNAGGVTIEGLAIYGFEGVGVTLNNSAGSAGNVLSGCYVGTDANGDAGVGNWTGVQVEGPNNTVGDTAGVATTIVSGNQQDGIDVSGANAVGDLINDVWVGVGLTGLTALGNGGNGILLNGDGSSDNDVVSGNIGDGIEVKGSSNFIYDDLIGVGPNGTTPMPNAGDGVHVGASSNNIIGLSGLGQGGRNIIAGNRGSGVQLDGGAQDNLISGNFIGLDKNGNKQGNQVYGVTVQGGSHSNSVGGIAAGAGNLISGNSIGVNISGTGTIQNLVAGNLIGVNSSGSGTIGPNGTSTGNTEVGVFLGSGASANTVGGTAAGAGNVISGNGSGAPLGGGVAIENPGTNNNLVAGNFIGTDASGDMAIGNDGRGVVIAFGASANAIGGAAAGAGNVISANSSDGVAIEGSNQNQVAGNRIGTDVLGQTSIGSTGDSLGNSGNGVKIDSGASANTVGGTAAGSLNVISGKAASGVLITGAGTDTNIVEGDSIGTDKLGGTAIDNGTGVTIQNGASFNTVGGAVAGSLNVISGNCGSGVTISDQGTFLNVVQGNYIGTDKSGGKALGNGIGLIIANGASENTVGGSVAGSLNVISGNGGNGVLITDNGTSANLVVGNDIGTDNLGGTAIPNDAGVVIQNGASSNVIGGTVSSGKNVISGNYQDGVDITGSGSATNLVEGDFIGTNAAGNAALGNGSSGVRISTGAANNTVGSLNQKDPVTGALRWWEAT